MRAVFGDMPMALAVHTEQISRSPASRAVDALARRTPLLLRLFLQQPAREDIMARLLADLAHFLFGDAVPGDSAQPRGEDVAAAAALRAGEAGDLALSPWIREVAWFVRRRGRSG